MKTLCRRLIIQKPKWSRNLILGIESSCDDSGAAIIEYVGKFFFKTKQMKPNLEF